jgi:FMN phosphatase YigB (HAD superfamily)
MIKNIVFDLGNVLISFKPSEYFDKKNYPENIKATILKDIFASKEWAMLDNGEINTNQAIIGIASASSLKTEEIAHIFNLRSDLIFPIDTNVRLLPGLKKRGYRLYYLSNFPMDLFEEVKTGYYFFKHFTGGTISAEAKSSKPDNRIFEYFLEKFSIVPEESLFIDDLEVNILAAVKFGFNVLHTTGAPEISNEIEKALK